MAASAIAAEFWETGKCETCPVYDMHGHMGMWHSIYFPRPEPEQMLRSMQAAGVRLLCFAHHAALLAPDIGNAASEEAVRRFPEHFRAYMSIVPDYPEIIERDLARFDNCRDVYVGLKLLADYHGVPITDARYRSTWEFAEERSLPVLVHTWGGSLHNGASHVREIAGRYPAVRMLLGHSLNNHWDEAIAIARDFPQTYLELTSVLFVRGVVERFCETVGSERVLYGTDLPWFSEHHAIGALLSEDITEDDRHNICHRNAEKLLDGLL